MEELKSCGLCDKALNDEENQVLDNLFIEMLDVLLINLNIKNTDAYPVCDICIEKIRSAFGFKTSCIETMDCLIPYIGSDGKITTDLKTVYINERQDDKDEQIGEDTDVCRLCMKLIKKESGTRLLHVLEELHFSNNFKKYVPEVALFAIENPIICNFCLISLQHLSDLIFMTSCLNSNIAESDHSESNKSDLLVIMASKFNDDLSKNMETIDQSSNITSGEQTNEDIDHIMIINNSLPVLRENTGTESCSSQTEDKTDEINKESVPSSIHETSTSCYTVPTKKHADLSTCNDKTIEIPNSSLESHSKSIIVEDMELSQEISDSDSDIEAISVTNEVIEIDEDEDDVQVVDDAPGTEDSTTIYECDICFFQSKEFEKYYEHENEHVKYEMSKKVIDCTICNFKCRGPSAKDSHMLAWHKDSVEKQKNYCKLCKFSTDYRYYFKEHLKQHKLKEKYYECELCVYKSKYSVVLKLHFDLEHKTEYYTSKHNLKYDFKKGTEGLYHCPHCVFKTIKKSVILGHIVRNHVINECTSCDYTTFKKHYYDKHRKAHINNKLYEFKCHYCGLETDKRCLLSEKTLKKKTICKKCLRSRKLMALRRRKAHLE